MKQDRATGLEGEVLNNVVPSAGYPRYSGYLTWGWIRIPNRAQHEVEECIGPAVQGNTGKENGNYYGI